MKIHLEVLATTSIQCRKPWRHIVWLGKEKESLFLLDEKRVSVLYVPSGKTKRNIPKLSSLLSETVSLTPAPNGLFLVGVQSSGEVFVWHKDKDELKTIVGLSSHLVNGDITTKDGCQVFPCPDCSQLLLVLANKHVFLWQKDKADDSKSNTLLGKWSRIKSSSNINIPSPEGKEVTMHAAFSSTEVLGYCCHLSLVYNHQANLCVSSLLVQFSPDVASSSLPASPHMAATWTFITRPLGSIQPKWEPNTLRGGYVCQYSHDGQILAVGVNQKSPAQTNVLFMSAFKEFLLVSDLKGCGIKDPGSKRGRQYWISAMAWTNDNLFLAVTLCNGSASLITRLGEPVVIFSKSAQLGPGYFLSFNPLISVQTEKKQEAGGYDRNDSSHSELDPLHQKFSVSTHPSLPIVLYSDGYIVTIVQLPNDLSPVVFMRDLVLDSSSHLRQISEAFCLDLTLANAYNLPAGDLENVKMPAYRTKHSKPCQDNYHLSFEEASASFNETLDSEVSFALGAHQSGKSHLGAVENMSSGKIIFGEPDVLLVTDSSFLNEPESTLKNLQVARMNLFSVWKLAASTTELWSANMDKIMDHTVHNIVKMFSLLLDCPQVKQLLDEASEQLVNLPAVHTASIFKVVSIYKQLLDLLQFDHQQHHLLAQTLQLAHKTLNTILVSPGLSQTDPRIKTLTGCFTLLKFTETNMQLVYDSSTLKSTSVIPVTSLGAENHKPKIKKAESGLTDSQLGKRLTASWKLLYKYVLQFIASKETSAVDVRQAQTLKSAVEQHLVELDIDIPKAPAVAINNGELLSLDGKHTLAVNAWKEQLQQYQELNTNKNASSLLHSLLYTHILRNDLITAISFVDDLIMKASPDRVHDLDPDQTSSHHNLKQSVLLVITSDFETQALHDPDMVPCIPNIAIRKVVQSMARFMAAYFTNQLIFIYPPHNPSPLPAVHLDTPSRNHHIIPKYQEDVAAIVRHQKLDSIWTVERTLEYLLLTGLLCEAIWFADRVGDWKAAYQLSVAHVVHKQIAPIVYEKFKRPLSVPEWLTPDAIMKRKLEGLVKEDLKLTKESSDLTNLTKVLRNISLSGIMGFSEVGPWLLEQLVAKLKLLVKQLSPLVNKDVYLPAPPLYLHQPSKTEQRHYSQEALEELALREKISSLIQLALCVMNAANISVPAAQWYVCALNKVQKTASQFKVHIEGPCLSLPDVLCEYAETGSENEVFSHPAEDDSVLSVQSSFRDLCTIVWLLHARDKLSLALRTREKNLNIGLNTEDSDQLLKESFQALQWAVHMITFSRFLPDEASFYKVVLSLLLDFPSTEDMAIILAELMYDLENLHPEVQERLDRLLVSWQAVILRPESFQKSFEESDTFNKVSAMPGTSPRGQSLSVYFHKQCVIMDKVLQKKKNCFGSYEEFVFAEDKSDSRLAQLRTIAASSLNIGSRPFETKLSFLKFLDTFFAVGFNKALELVIERNNTVNIPFLRVFSEGIVKREIKHFVEQASDSMHKRQQGLSVLTGASKILAKASSQDNVNFYIRNNHESPRSVRSVPGWSSGHHKKTDSLKKAQNLTGKSVGLFRGVNQSLRSNNANVRRYESDPALDDHDSSDDLEVYAESPMKRSQKNITSRYCQSDEDIYQSGQGRPAWSLTVSFGKKYAALQQIVGWLETWGSKSHALGLHGFEEILDTNPQIKIHIPAQLIVLSLWLLEHKYRHNKENDQRPEQFNVSRRFRRLSPSFRSQSLSPHKSTETESKKIIPASQRSPQLSDKRISRKQATTNNHRGQREIRTKKTRKVNDQVLRLSPSLDQDQMINAYTQVLTNEADPDDSSSIDVSSLASDELDGDLKTTLNAIRRTASRGSLKENSALNQTLITKDDFMLQKSILPQNSSTSLKQDTAPTSLQKQTKEANTNQSKSKGNPPDLSKHDIKIDVGEEIADQLQGVIRNELRRIMELQHRNVIAMMGALDDDSVGGKAPESLYQASITRHSSQEQRHQQRVRSPKISKTHCETQTSPSHHRQHDNDISAQVNDHFSMTQARKKQNVRESHMRETLTELQNLQYATQQPSFQQRPFQRTNIAPINQKTDDIFSQNYRNKLQLPFIAWTDNIYQQPPPLPQPGIPSLPLLQINKMEDNDYPFKNFRRFLSQVPSLQTNYFHPARYFVPPTAPPAHSSFSFFTPQFQRPPPPPPPPLHHQPLHSLSTLPSDRSAPYFPLLRMPVHSPMAVGSGIGNNEVIQKEKVEQTRQKMLQQFHQHVLQNKENVDHNLLAHQLLQLESSQEMIARSEKMQESAKDDQADSKVDIESSVKDQKGVTPAFQQQQQQQHTTPDMADASTSDTHINDGYAFPRGIFDSYIHLGEQLVGQQGSETNAAFQLRLAQAMQQHAENRVRAMVDFNAMSQHHAAERFFQAPPTKDTGVDPIQEAVSDYNARRHNNLIPPDIFMGLRFGDQESQSGIEPAAPSSVPGRGRSYLNVVDINASTILRDIPEHAEKSESLLDQDQLDTAILNSQKTVQQIEALEDVLRQKFAPRLGSQGAPSYDAVTVKLFDQLRKSKDNLMSVAVMPRSSVSQPKAAMIRRLQDMSDQIKAIDEMSQNIEREFKSSHLLLKTIQDLNESVQIHRSSSPTRPVDQMTREVNYLTDEKKEEPRQRSPDYMKPKTSAKSPQTSARSRSTQGSRSRSEERLVESENELTKLITEVLIQEGVDPQVAGFSELMAEQLEMDTRQQIQRSRKVTGSKHVDNVINMKQADEHVRSRTPYERYELKLWMTQKFRQRQEEYMKKRKELIEREPKPFKSQSNVTKLDLKSLEEMSEKRLSMMSEFMNKRLIQAEQLMGSIIVDKPEIPWRSVSSSHTQRKNQSRSPIRSGTYVSPPRHDVLRSRPSERQRINQTTWTHRIAPSVRDRSPHETDRVKLSRDTSPVKSILKSPKGIKSGSSDLQQDQQVLTSISEEDKTAGSSTDLIDYARQVLEKDGRDMSPGDSYENVQEQHANKEHITQTPSRIPTPKGKSYVDVVRMQRPETTRKWDDINRRRQIKEREKQSALAKPTATQNPNLMKDRVKEYGSKHIPGFNQGQSVPRRVKTYAERLQKMKKNSTTKSAQPTRKASSPYTRTAPVGPPTQLHNLRYKAVSSHQGGRTGGPVMMRTFLKSHGPKHKPKTYAEQLQELNPYPHKDNEQKKNLQATVTLKGQIPRSNARSRPYSDPYSEVDYEELASVLSDWDVDENIRKIIYGGLSSASSNTLLPMNDNDINISGSDLHFVAPFENQSDYFDVVMHEEALGRLDEGGDFDDQDYRSSVDVHEIERIAELASVNSGSILSVIDWDAVEDLIKDV